MRNVINLSV